MARERTLYALLRAGVAGLGRCTDMDGATFPRAATLFGLAPCAGALPAVPVHCATFEPIASWPTLSYVAEDEKGRVVGYILAKMFVFLLKAPRARI